MTLPIGTQLGSHEITARLGKGGMGEVYRARDLKLKREVAIKILPEEFSRDADRVNRFQREAEVLASLNHPNIAAIHDFQETNGTRYLVLELVEGETLADRIARGPLPVQEALNIATQICEALEAAHERGVIHRDLKPANVKVTLKGRVKVLDFGLAKAFHGSDFDRDLSELPTINSATMAGHIVGTPGYMSPEQARGRAVDQRTDVWSFGCLLYELLTGKPAFQRDTLAETISAVLEGRVDWKALPPKTPANVRELLQRCLEREVTLRLDNFAKARRMLEDDPRRASSGAFLRLAAAVLIAVLSAVAFWKISSTRDTSPIHRIAVLPLENISGDSSQEAFSDGTTEAIISDLAQVHSLSVISHTSVMHYKGGQKTIPEIARELHADAFVTGTVERVGGRVRVNAQLINASSDRNMWGARFDREGADILQLEEDVAQAIAHGVQAQITPEESKRLTRATKVSPAAYDEYLLGRYLTWKNNGAEPFRQAIEHLQHAILLDPNFAAAHAQLATAWTIRFAQGFAEFAEAEGAARSEEVRAQTLDPELAETHAAVAHVAMSFDWDWVKGEQELRKSLEIDPNSLDMCGCIAITLIVLDRPQEALTWLDHAMQINPLSSEIEALYGWALVNEHRPEDALPHLNRARELDPQNMDTFLSLPLALEETGKPEEAVKLIERLGPSGMLARAYIQVGRRRDAQNLISQLKDPWDLAIAYQSLGDTNRALDAIALALERREFNATMIKTDPTFESLRSNGRFRELMGRLKMPQPPGAR